MTSFSGEEFTAVVAAALLGLDDEAQITVVIHTPGGTQYDVERVWYDPTTRCVVIEPTHVQLRAATTHWMRGLEDELLAFNPINPNWAGMAQESYRRRNYPSPLRDINIVDPSDEKSEES